ncbi:hypothetical protein [Streptomyces longhuiensis]|uniref:hypothetical protein n=1 Tax=Streptomyces longhuiensis TaxID=2880933 RepID=UPI001D0AC4D6|nr:hypothetical protein [Streptomyces longhuiensis]UDM00040.1 hypothetical protein LGI35_18025 [Streptomyces longhuiensis]
MQIRADVAELLRAGLSDKAIASELGVDAKKTVRRARVALGIAPVPSGKRPASSPEDLFWHRVQPTDDGHLIWTGYRSRVGTLSLRHGGRTHTALRIAFRIKHGREPEGHVTPTCDRDGCVAPAHTQDRRIREQTNALFTAIFREVSA